MPPTSEFIQRTEKQGTRILGPGLGQQVLPHSPLPLYREPLPRHEPWMGRRLLCSKDKALNAGPLAATLVAQHTPSALFLQGERKDLHPNASKEVPRPTQAPASLTGKSSYPLLHSGQLTPLPLVPGFSRLQRVQCSADMKRGIQNIPYMCKHLNNWSPVGGTGYDFWPCCGGTENIKPHLSSSSLSLSALCMGLNL